MASTSREHHSFGAVVRAAAESRLKTTPKAIVDEYFYSPIWERIFEIAAVGERGLNEKCPAALWRSLAVFAAFKARSGLTRAAFNKMSEAVTDYVAAQRVQSGGSA